jgi:hypothetical protein
MNDEVLGPIHLTPGSTSHLPTTAQHFTHATLMRFPLPSTLSNPRSPLPTAVHAFELPKPAVFIIAAITGPEIASIHGAEIASVLPGLAEVREYSQAEVLEFLQRKEVLDGMMPEVWEEVRKTNIAGRHLLDRCHDPAFLTPHLGPAISDDIAKLVEKLYAAAGMSCFRSSPKYVSNCNIAHPLPNATIELISQEPQRRRAVCTHFPHDFLIEGLLSVSRFERSWPI